MGGGQFYMQTGHPQGRYVDFVETVELVQLEPGVWVHFTTIHDVKNCFH